MALGRMAELVNGTEVPVDRLIRLVNPWVSYVILPVFALANAGVPVSAEALSAAAFDPVALGVFIALVVGKPIGIAGACWLSERLGIAKRPAQLEFRHLIGMGLLGGIGFTISLFFTELAFAGSPELNRAKMGIFAASLVAGALGYGYLRFMRKAEQ